MNEMKVPKIDRIIRSKRRSVALIVYPDATLTVRAPFWTSLDYIKDFVFKKRDWINKKQMRILKNGGPQKPKKFEDGEEFLFLGEPCRFYFENRNVLAVQERRANAIAWYRRQALAKITERVALFSRKTCWKYKSISVTNAQSRWGSCSAKGSLNFSWRLIMAPLNVIDYVVVHELAHIPEKNHSPRFWKKVADVMPDYKDRRKWLRDNISKFNV